MTGKTHEAAGLFLTAIALNTGLITAPLPTIFFGAGCIYGSLVPDVDAQYSIIKNNSEITVALYDFCKILFPSKKLFKHRGITHNIILPMMVAIIAFLIPVEIIKMLLAGIAIGWIFHIFLDNLQKIIKCKNGSFPDLLLRIWLLIGSVFLLFLFGGKLNVWF